MASFSFGLPARSAPLDASSFVGLRFFEDSELAAAEKINIFLRRRTGRTLAARIAREMPDPQLEEEYAAARTALLDGTVHDALDTLIWIVAARAELRRRDEQDADRSRFYDEGAYSCCGGGCCNPWARSPSPVAGAAAGLAESSCSGSRDTVTADGNYLAASSCAGCREGQPNQMAHMESGGCCYVEEA